MNATGLSPDDLHPPRAWRPPRVSTRTTPGGFTETVVCANYVATDHDAIRLAAEKVIADLDGRRAEPPRYVAAQLVAHHILYSEPLPAVVLKALAAALRVGRQVRAKNRASPSWASEAEVEEVIRLLSNLVEMEAKDRRRLYDVVRWFTDRGQPLPASILGPVAKALGLTDRDGHLRQTVREALALSPVGEMQLVGPEYVEPEGDEDDSARAVWRERPAEPRVGLRSPEPFNRAVKTEAMARARTGRLGKPAMTYQALADEVGEEFNTIRTWAGTDRWRRAVYSQAYHLRNRVLFDASIEAEAAARAESGDCHTQVLSNRDLAKRVGLDEATIHEWTTTTPRKNVDREALGKWAVARHWQMTVAARASLILQGL